MDISTATIAGQVVHDGQVAAAFNQFLIALLTLASTAVATLGGVFIKTKLNAENSTWKQKIAYRLVCYAENQIVGDDSKQKYVADKMHEILPSVTSDEVKHLLEEAVVQLRATQTGTPVVAAATVEVKTPPAAG